MDTKDFEDKLAQLDNSVQELIFQQNAIKDFLLNLNDKYDDTFENIAETMSCLKTTIAGSALETNVAHEAIIKELTSLENILRLLLANKLIDDLPSPREIRFFVHLRMDSHTRRHLIRLKQ